MACGFNKIALGDDKKVEFLDQTAVIITTITRIIIKGKYVLTTKTYPNS